MPVGIITAVAFLALILSACNHSVTQQTASQSPQTQSPHVNFQASFAVFTNDVFRVFTASMYHNRSGDVYIEVSNANVVNVKKSGITWGDFFKTLPMELTSDCLTTGTGEKFCNSQTKTLKFYINGQKADNFQNTEIKDGDKALISYGQETEAQIQNQLKKISEPVG